MNPHMLEQNPFFLLHVTPRDDDQTILSRALEAKLLLGQDTKEAQNALLSPSLRLESEVGFLPGMEEQDIAALEAWVNKNRSGTVPGTIPGFEPESVLARLNGVSAFLQQWPIEDTESACAACFALAGICDRVTALQTMKDLNGDRKAGNRELLTHLPAVSKALEEHIHSLCAELAGRCGKLSASQYRKLEETLSKAYCTPESPWHRSPFLDRMVCLHLAHTTRALASEEKAAIEKTIEDFVQDAEKNCPGKDLVSLRTYQAKAASSRMAQVMYLVEKLQRWNTLTTPERAVYQAKGMTSDQSREMFETVHAFLCDLNNQYKDYTDAKMLVLTIEGIFTDLPQDKIDLIRKNKDIILGNH